MEFNFNLQDLTYIAKEILRNVPNKTLLFYGTMGVGKTTLIKELSKQLGVTDVINSPTFSLVNEYEIMNDKIYHFDFYRIKSEEEALDIGIEDYFFSGHWNLIEWPENISNLLPPNSTKIEMNKNQNGTRTLNIVF
ncbi:tRNA (adenosine(37)-N6)-threonylcarbamoyltransferase complex ATPase subunit type 1 TsaE [Flavobacteriaceae bacterium]|nr:tRNA (adenosine(37)-N6)-threonylcarbamoyltransferase complex ATPase subunit type 1 TsaE [Flavobacteriaceae bacterium]MDB4591383.1 tRNA (adenosine(37)-N6)-threonylcarbamoyltransferase complex ATPase subunit type 1 TsaE [Flavobacteriaceae bacterium]MDC6467631.1 tRNA (adenosine(37)-N6)-threonylcarbamoyltransferase complex ATPase subunit type 1 TsaE [Flavobacteriaceae bacterium]|tara:strand:- start:6030 stop:6437 length:408 start_codon:yes stop_codon:yes gene_type:complete